MQLTTSHDLVILNSLKDFTDIESLRQIQARSVSQPVLVINQPDIYVG